MSKTVLLSSLPTCFYPCTPVCEPCTICSHSSAMRSTGHGMHGMRSPQTSTNVRVMHPLTAGCVAEEMMLRWPQPCKQVMPVYPSELFKGSLTDAGNLCRVTAFSSRILQDRALMPTPKTPARSGSFHTDSLQPFGMAAIEILAPPSQLLPPPIIHVPRLLSYQVH